MHRIFVVVVGIGFAATGQQQLPPDHAEKMTRGTELFTKQVRGILTERCLHCHGGVGETTRGDFDMTTRERLLHGGDAAVVVPFDHKKSKLVRLITHADKPHMPHKADKLADREIALIKQWIDLGAPYDRPLLDKIAGKKPLVVTDKDRQFWSFQPLRVVAPPSVKNAAWCRTPLDRFILAKLEEKGLTPTGPLERAKLIRRVTYDLLGLPPTPEEIAAFVTNTDPDAYVKLIDRLLDSPHFGEKWARHWLDLARFAESSGYEHDYDRPFAYHYRDFVIKAFNTDLPYNQFVQWQIAGDEYEPANPLALMATGFLAAGTHSTQTTKNLVEKERYEQLDDKLRTLGTSMLGLTIGCARCHDHKYDPIPTKDYYRLLATFTTTVKANVAIVLDPTAAPRRTRIKVLIASEGVPPLRMHTQGGDFFEQTFFLKRGDPDQKEGVATQGFLQVLMRHPDAEKHWQTPPPKGWHTSYRRRALAEWITDVDHGAGQLLARVIVNRLWQHHLGRGIVGTPSDFGAQGEAPSHPELLDFLANELIKNGWRLKPIHKLIMTSAVYVQSSEADPKNVAIDPENRYFWFHPRQRLQAESIRDALLSVSGTLDERPFGPGTLDPHHKRRSIYFFVKRSKLVPALVLFDAPDALGGMDKRPTTTVAPQALWLLNNEVVRGYAEALARRVSPSAETPPGKAVQDVYRLALGRSARAAELKVALQFLQEQAASYVAEGRADARQLALGDFCQVLLSLNEFIYID